MNQLRPYQEKTVYGASKLLSEGKRKLVVQSHTGSGKTVMFSTICDRFIAKQNKRILILVHRTELLGQTRKTLFSWYGINAQAIDADTKQVFDRMVYVGMVETVYKRLKKNPNWLPEVGMVIIDEAHIANFHKLHDFFPGKYILGFTATPQSASKKHPLKEYFEDVIVGASIKELIDGGALVQNHTYSIKGINRDNLKIASTGDFDEHEMSQEYSKTKHVQNTVDAYVKHSLNKKTIVFNCSIAHSKLVNEAFLAAGFNSRHFDSTMGDEVRKEVLHWFKETPDAILNNIGILTAGFDEPSVQTVIMNRSTLSMPLWLQVTGRGGRPYEAKEYFTILDMGGNAVNHGDWCDDRDWVSIFHNPPKPRDKKQAPPCKECPECESIIPASATTCKFCGYAFPRKEQEYDILPIELELVTKNLNVKEMSDMNEAMGKKPYATMFQIGNNLATQAKYRLGKRLMTDNMAYQILKLYQEKTKEWLHTKGKRWNDWHRKVTQDHLFKELKRAFPKWEYEVQTEIIP
jgi:superfamily II DNA or RNA helicase